MQKTIFYSWQSDLPNNTNRTFIESCLEKVIKDLKKDTFFPYEVLIAQDTREETGTPDIANTIFNKIDKSSIFVADISITNKHDKKRKTPNPNVLVELGYAAKTLGWDKIICLYNLDYGDFKDLPFDLRQRRPLEYSINKENKAKMKSKISKILMKSIQKMNSTGSLENIVDEFIKVQIDTQILTIIRHLFRIFYGYKVLISFERINKFLNMNDTEFYDILVSNSFLGFFVFKDWEINKRNIKELAEKSLSSNYQNIEYSNIIIELSRWVGSFNKFNKLRSTPDLFECIEDVNDKKLKAVAGISVNPKNAKFPDRFMLLFEVENGKYIVIDFGDFIEKPKIEGLIKSYKLNKKYVKSYSKYISDFISIVEKWLDKSNNTFLIDNIEEFELKLFPEHNPPNI